MQHSHVTFFIDKIFHFFFSCRLFYNTQTVISTVQMYRNQNQYGLFTWNTYLNWMKWNAPELHGENAYLFFWRRNASFEIEKRSTIDVDMLNAPINTSYFI